MAVSGIGNATAVTAGFSHACAIDAKQAKCWGRNDFGELGNGSTTQSAMPVMVSGIGNATAVVGGEYHSCAIDGGQVKCWGLNNWGQLGDGSITDRAVPVLVAGGLVAPPPANPNEPLAPPPPTKQAEYTVSVGVIPEAAVTATASGTLGSATLSVTLDLSLLFPSGAFSAQGRFAAGYNVYVAARVPGARLGLPGAAWFMLPRTRTWTQLALPIVAYLENVAQGGTLDVPILRNLDMTGLVGTEFYIGYGLDGDEMLARGRYRGIYIVQ